MVRKKKAKTTARGKQMRRKLTIGTKKAMGSSFSGSLLALLSGNDEEEKEEEDEEDEEQDDEEEDEEDEEEEEDEGRKGWSD